MKTFSNWPTYPQLYVKGELVGGLDIVKVRSQCAWRPESRGRSVLENRVSFGTGTRGSPCCLSVLASLPHQCYQVQGRDSLSPHLTVVSACPHCSPLSCSLRLAVGLSPHWLLLPGAPPAPERGRRRRDWKAVLRGAYVWPRSESRFMRTGLNPAGLPCVFPAFLHRLFCFGWPCIFCR